MATSLINELANASQYDTDLMQEMELPLSHLQA
jgi:hypothetical protein